MTHVATDPGGAAEACARYIAERLEAAGPRPAIALSGGSGPRLLFERLAAAPFDRTRVHFFWADERVVPPEDPRSNYRLAMETLLGGVPEGNVHRVAAELGPEAAARAYADEIRAFFDGFPRFDVIHLGMGEDAHTASLFPGDPLIDDRDGIAAAAHVDAEPPWRVTLLPGVLGAARQAVMFVTGAGKADAVRAVLHGPYDPRRYPAQLVRDSEWFLDRAAAGD
jgi:6-phosphogluconolactonase